MTNRSIFNSEPDYIIKGSRPEAKCKFDFDRAPYLVLWELTRACQLACKHCRARAVRRRNPGELTMKECENLLDRLQEFGQPLIVFTGGDPIEHPDLYDIIAAAKERGFPVAITPSATPSISAEIIERLKLLGVDRIAVSIDGIDASSHDTFRQVRGSFELSIAIARWCNEFGIPLQINSTITRHNVHTFDDLATGVRALKAVLWSVFFLVPTGRATQDMQISARECESILKRMALIATKGTCDVKATAAPHFRRVLLENFSQRPEDAISQMPGHLALGRLRSYQSVNDGKGALFISHVGGIYPSGFLPLVAGNIRRDDIVDVYQNSPLFKTLRDPGLLKGKCGACRYKAICGGSRARAYAETGDYLQSDGLCVYRSRTAEPVSN